MINFDKMQQVQHAKTGTVGWLVSTYNRTTDGKKMAEVITLSRGMKTAYWDCKYCQNI
jgi:hypothetical protein